MNFIFFVRAADNTAPFGRLSTCAKYESIHTSLTRAAKLLEFSLNKHTGENSDSLAHPAGDRAWARKPGKSYGHVRPAGRGQQGLVTAIQGESEPSRAMAMLARLRTTAPTWPWPAGLT